MDGKGAERFDLSRSQRGTPHDIWRRFHYVAIAAGIGFATLGAVVLALLAPLPASTGFWIDVGKAAFLLAAGAGFAYGGARGLRNPTPAMLRVDGQGLGLTLSDGRATSVRWDDPDLGVGVGRIKHEDGRVVDLLVCQKLSQGVQHDLIYLFPAASVAVRREAHAHGLPREEGRFAVSAFGWSVDGGTRFGRYAQPLPAEGAGTLPFLIVRTELRLRRVAEGGVPMLLIAGLSVLAFVGVLGALIAWATRSSISTGTLVDYSATVAILALLLGDYLGSAMRLRPRESTWTLEERGLVYRETMPPQYRREGWANGRSYLFQLPVRDVRSDRTWDWNDFEITAMGVWGATKVDPTKVQLTFRPKQWRTSLPVEPTIVVTPAQAKAVLLAARSHGGHTRGAAGVLATLNQV